ncbi:uncharacterized protein [Ptychodera flava]|uniref:uncharacterized protein n=1 Tax=Ptychodera flava TaxID=63121 RepID=UPI00396A3E2A
MFAIRNNDICLNNALKVREALKEEFQHQKSTYFSFTETVKGDVVTLKPEFSNQTNGVCKEGKYSQTEVSDEKQTHNPDPTNCTHVETQPNQRDPGEVAIHVSISELIPAFGRAILDASNALFELCSFKTTLPQNLLRYNPTAYIKNIKRGSMVYVMGCRTSEALEHLWSLYQSKGLGELVEKSIMTDTVLTDIGALYLKLRTTIDPEEYRQCKEELSLPAEPANDRRPDINDTRRCCFHFVTRDFSKSIHTECEDKAVSVAATEENVPGSQGDGNEVRRFVEDEAVSLKQLKRVRQVVKENVMVLDISAEGFLNVILEKETDNLADKQRSKEKEKAAERFRQAEADRPRQGEKNI